MKFQRNFVLSRDTLVHVGQGKFEGVVLADFEAEDAAVEVGRAPVPALDAQLPVQHVHFVGGLEELGQSLLLRVLEAGEPVQVALRRKDPDTPRPSDPLPVDHLDLVGGDGGLALGALLRLELQFLVGHLESTVRLKEDDITLKY